MREPRFKVIRASAGSGKTYALVRSYLEIVFSSPDSSYYRQILAVTFTNKATAEMKTRILEAMEGLASGSVRFRNLHLDLEKRTGLKSGEISKRALAALNHLIHNYADFAVSTIDRFVYRIIRSFSFELNLPAGLEIELDRDRILQKSVDSLFDRLDADGELLKLMVEFAEYKFSSDKSFDIRNDLLEMAAEISDEKARPYLEELESMSVDSFDAVRGNMDKRIKDIRKDIQSKAENLRNIFTSYGLEASDLAGGSTGVFSFVNHYCKDKFDLKSPGKGVQALVEGAKWSGSKIPPDKKVVVEGLETQLRSCLSDLLNKLTKEWMNYHFCRAMRLRLHSLALVSEINKEINHYKKDNEILQLDDFNKMISGLIEDNPVPYIYERSGEKFRHYLIDEFQDTSVTQWFNLLPLIENSLSTGNDSLVVGDVKQAIYRWRGGEAAQMSRLPELSFPDKNEEVTQFWSDTLRNFFDDSDKLKINWRSAEAVVSFVNGFFRLVREDHPELTDEIYADHEQDVKAKEVKGSVEIRFLEPDKENVERKNEVLTSVKSFLELGYEYGDMAILCRKKDQCSLLADFLIQSEIPVISSESLLLSASPEVSFLVDWLFYLNEGNDGEYGLKIMKYLADQKVLPDFGHDELVTHLLAGKGLKELIDEFFSNGNLFEHSTESLHEFISTLSGNFLKHKSADVFVIGFIDQVTKFQNKWGNDAGEFLNWWLDRGVNISVEIPQKTDAVRILTVHKAKGLEFDVVLVPFMIDTIKSGQKHFWIETENEDSELTPVAWLPSAKSLLDTRYGQLYTEEMNRSFVDTLNLMYVAMTRAAHHLVIFSESGKMDNEWKENYLLSKCYRLKDYKGSEESGRFLVGERTVIERQKEAGSNEMIFTEAGDLQWKKKIQLKYRIDYNVLEKTGISKVEYGNLLHDMLSNVNTLDEIEAELRSMESRVLLDSDLVERMNEDIMATLKNSEVEMFFKDPHALVYNERELLSKDGRVLRPDRMVIRDQKLVIIDYKTGSPDESHLMQVSDYISVIKDVGDFDVSAYLIYFSDRMVKKVA